MIDVIESLVVGKVPGNQFCEDTIFVNENFALVADGATDKTGWSNDGKLGGKVAIDICLEVVAKLPADINFRDTVDLLTERLAEVYEDESGDGPSAVLVIVSAQRREIWQLGDVSFSVPSQDIWQKPQKEIDKYVSICRSILLETYIHQGISIDELRDRDPGREMIQPILNSQFQWRNQLGTWGYGAIDGSHVPDEFLFVTPLPVEKTEIILCSDGYPDIFDDLQTAEDSLSEMLEIDPLCIGQLRGTKSWKKGNNSFDDRAFLRINV